MVDASDYDDTDHGHRLRYITKGQLVANVAVIADQFEPSVITHRSNAKRSRIVATILRRLTKLVYTGTNSPHGAIILGRNSANPQDFSVLFFATITGPALAVLGGANSVWHVHFHFYSDSNFQLRAAVTNHKTNSKQYAVSEQFEGFDGELIANRAVSAKIISPALAIQGNVGWAPVIPQAGLTSASGGGGYVVASSGNPQAVQQVGTYGAFGY